MAQEIIQTQEQKLAQQQRLSQQQMLQVKLLEMPLAELEQKVRMELDDNPALESKTPEQNDNFEPEAPADDKDDGMNEYEREERQDEITPRWSDWVATMRCPKWADMVAVAERNKNTNRCRRRPKHLLRHAERADGHARHHRKAEANHGLYHL